MIDSLYFFFFNSAQKNIMLVIVADFENELEIFFCTEIEIN